MLRQGKRVTAAALVILVLGITADLGPAQHSCVSQISHPCEHDCVAQTLPPGSGFQAKPAPQAQHVEQRNVLCAACLLKAQFSSLSLSIAPRIPPPQTSILFGADRHGLPTDFLHLHWDARAPPYASPESSTV
jgi:hypothetical protein